MNAQDTSAETKPDLPLEIAHLLLIDVVGYSTLLVNEQIELLQELNQIVIRASKKLLPHLHQSDRRASLPDEYCNCRPYSSHPALYFYTPQALGRVTCGRRNVDGDL